MFLEDLSSDWERNGADAIAECRRTDVATYVRPPASPIPKEFGVRVSANPLVGWTDEQLQVAMEALEAVPATEEHMLIESDFDRNFVAS